MKASELRLGNLIEWSNGFSPKELVEITPRWFGQLAGGQSFEDQKISGNSELNGYWSPIEITEEWLIKLGFSVLHENNKHYFIRDPNGYKDSHKIHIFPTIGKRWHIAFSDSMSGKNRDYSPTTNIKYIHELQNLIFALTRQEIILSKSSPVAI